MPSITEENGDSGSSSKQNNLEPILGTGLNIPSLEKSALISSESISVPTTKQHRAPVQKKAIARPSTNPNVNNNYNINNQSASSSNPSLTSFQTPAPAVVRSDVQDEKDHHLQIATKSSREEDPYGSFVSQVYDWLQHERARRRNARKMKASSTATTAATPTATTVTDGAGDEDDGAAPPLERTSSQSSDTSASLDRLESILLPHADKRYESGSGPKRISRRRPVRGLRSGSLSESDHPDIEAAAPSVETFLDNTKTLASSGGAADGEEDETSLGIKQANDKENWHIFKSDILRIVHTLRLKGWRRVPMDSAGDIDVVRLSGALTNAVYVVAPPPSYPPDSSIKSAENSSSTSAVSKRPPPKLLLRIYGPQVEHLIDREKELQILRRLGRKNIGPRVLGTFRNGRFEQYYEARPLTPNDLRIPDTYRQIAKRMRELHQGIELQPEEREGGPIVFKNWDKWVDRCEQVINWLDKEILSKHNEAKSQYEPWRRRGFVCGVPWPAFRKAVENYRKWLVANCGGFDEIKRQLVFAHNDTQYGNLLRLEPTGGSPLLTPANEHKQLIVIDFEYASANTPGFEFANHFSEWCYNYHDVEKPWAFDGKKYPVSEDQHRFISEYLKHKPGVSSASPFTTPSMSAMTGNTPRLAPLDLDEDSQQIPASHDTENTSEKYHEMDVQYFMRQTRLWRVFNSAQWVAWGIVQAKVPGMEEGIEAMAAGTETEAKNNGENDASTAATTSPLPSSTPDADADSVESDEFDYLAYSQDRAMFFWADLLALGLVKEDELPDKLVECAKPRALDY